jgi:DNA-binding MarR family transcriptional regulator
MTDSTVDALALENQVCFAVAVAARSILGIYRPILAPLGLTHPQYLVMLVLWQHGERSVVELGAALHLDSATLSPLLKRLEASGLVTRHRSLLDERMLVVALTTDGRALRERALAVPGQVVAKTGMSIQQLESLRDTLMPFVTEPETGETHSKQL